ncbi:CTC-interacting domain 7 protein [Prunus dulcis]|uniref:CTC-interacting domain 7 protein n=1 Tax=Prunus dulcis TaxID=3755 RepID=A0A4Y1QT83_PRUDU|nr:CTC-interacting domain 7 protein [Prunus dulcis]
MGGTFTNDTKLSTANKATALNPNAAEFVPFSLRSPSSGSTSTGQAATKFSSTGTFGKAVLDRTESSASNNSDEEAHQYWRHQLPDDITPDFKVMGEVSHKALGISLWQSFCTPFGDDLSSSSFLHMSPKPWDKQIVNSNQLISNGQEGSPYDGFSRQGFMNDMFSEHAVVDDTDINPAEFLASQFPGFSAQSLAEVYFANGCDLNLTIEMLTQLELQVDGGFNENLNSKTVSSPDLSSMDFPALTPTDGQHSHPKYGDDDLQQSGNPYRSSDKDNMLFFKSSSSIPSRGAIDFASAVRKLAAQDSGGWKFERNGSPEAAIGSSRRSQLPSTYNTGHGRGIYSDRSQNRGSARTAPVWLETGDAVGNMTANMYSDVRDEARDHARLRNAYFEQARQAYLIGNKALAKELSVKGQLHNMHMKEAHGKAQESIYRQRNPVAQEMQGNGRAQERMIDLHGLHVSEALHVLKHELSVLRSTARAGDPGLLVYICVGTGHHTRGSRTPARLPVAVQRYLLEEEGLDYTEPQPGLLRILTVREGLVIIAILVPVYGKKSNVTDRIELHDRTIHLANYTLSQSDAETGHYVFRTRSTSTRILSFGGKNRQCTQEIIMQLQANLRLKSIFLSTNNTSYSRTLFPLFNFSSLSYPISKSTHISPSSSSSSSSSQWFSVIRTAITTMDLQLGKRVHALIITSGNDPDHFLTNNLITMYSKCRSLPCARRLFDKTPGRDLVTWNSILAAYAQAAGSDVDNVQEGLTLFRSLRESVVFTSRLTLAPVIKLCLLSGNVWASEAVHGYAVKIGLEWDVFVSGALMNIYSKLGRIKEARALFDGMEERDVVLWNTMLKAYMEIGLEKEGLSLFSAFHLSGLRPDDVSVRSVLSGIAKFDFYEGKRNMEQVQAYAVKFYEVTKSDIYLWNKKLSDYVQAGVSGLELGKQIHSAALRSGFDSVVSVANSLINVYSKARSVYYVRKVFNNMKEVDLISWNSMISCCVQSGLGEESVILFIGILRDGLRPDQFTTASVLRACSSLEGGLYVSKQIHVHAIKSGIVADRFVSTALIDVYSRTGKMEEAEILFENKLKFNLASWNAMMFGYIMSNDSHKALKLMRMMHESGQRADEITLATVAKATSSLVALNPGKQIHAHAIKTGFSSDLFVNSGILDMYIKCGDMRSAHGIFNGIPAPDDVAWTTMISGCVENGDEGRSLYIYHQMRQSGVQPDEYTFATLSKPALV